VAVVHSRYIRGALAYYDTHRMRLLHAVGGDVIEWVASSDQFQQSASTGTDPAGWTTTVVEAGTGTSEADAARTAGSTFRLVTAANEDDGISIQRNGEVFELTSDQDVYFGIELQVTDADAVDFFVGLAITDTALLGGVTDAVYFESLDGSTDIIAVTEQDSTETSSSSVATLADDTNVILEFYWDGSSSTVYFFADGVQQATSTTNIPDDEALRISLEFLSGEASANTMTVRWARCIQIGR
jgi:hypothetical protein